MNGTTLKAAIAGGIAGALVAGGTAAVAGTGIGGVFNLGQTNTVNSPTALQGTAAGTQLSVGDTGTGAGITATAAGNASSALQGVNSAGGAGVSGTSVSGDGVQGVSASGGRGVYGYAVGTFGTSRAAVYGQGGGLIPGGWFTSGSGPGGKFSSYSGTALLAIGPQDLGKQGNAGDGVDAGTKTNSASGVYAHWDGGTGSGYGIYAKAPAGSQAGHFEGDVQVHGNLNVTGSITGPIQRLDFSDSLGGPDKTFAIGQGLSLVAQCYKDGGGDPTIRVLANDLGTAAASLNTSYVSNESSGNGDAWDQQEPVNVGTPAALVIGSTNTLGGLENPEATGQFVWRKPGETVTGIYDYYVSNSGCQFYGMAFVTS